MSIASQLLDRVNETFFPIQEMTNLRPRDSGVPLAIWVSQKGRARHDARIKISPSGTKAPKDDSISMEVDPQNMTIIGDHRKYDPRHLRLAHQFVQQNHQHLKDLWDEKIDFKDFEDRMQPVGSVRQGSSNNDTSTANS